MLPTLSAAALRLANPVSVAAVMLLAIPGLVWIRRRPRQPESAAIPLPMFSLFKLQ